jgi:hypothetical protein
MCFDAASKARMVSPDSFGSCIYTWARVLSTIQILALTSETLYSTLPFDSVCVRPSQHTCLLHPVLRKSWPISILGV